MFLTFRWSSLVDVRYGNEQDKYVEPEPIQEDDL